MIITLRNIKKINELRFEVPDSGVWVITGLNGTGKTSLFAAIYRISAQHAFQKFFKTSQVSNYLDSYHDSTIEYTINQVTATYHYGGQRWRATPRKNANLFRGSPFALIDYIEASGKRIEPYPNEITPRRLKNASRGVKEFLAGVLDDSKWDNLKVVNTSRGNANQAYLIPYRYSGRDYYYSEKSFSLGELCVLRLAQKICSVPNDSLLLIDEVEMALHPQAQVRLLQKVEAIAEEKSLTVLFSTHSATLIKNANRDHLIHLKADSNHVVSTVRNAFPGQILGDVAFDDELQADFIFYVEDKQAKLLTEQMLAKYMLINGRNNDYNPLYKVAPVGGFVQVLEMLKVRV